MGTSGGDVIREARRRAGLTQATLAQRAGTTQSGIARWEAGSTAVSLDDLVRLVRLCGFNLELAVVPCDESDLAQAERLAELSAQERMDRHRRLVRQMHRVREVRGA